MCVVFCSRSTLIKIPSTNSICFNLTLVRHAETNANAHGIIQGSLDTELSSMGYLQSRALARYLQDHHFSHIYSSDLKRASETARQIHLFNRVSSTNIQFDRRLRERAYGIAQGRTRQWLHELAKKYNKLYHDFTPTGAETVHEVRERAIKFFENLCAELVHEKKSSLSIDDLSSSFVLSGKYSFSTGNLHSTLTNEILPRVFSSSDSALDLTSLSSISSSSILSRNSSSELDILVVTHGAIIRELIKYFVEDLQTDLGKYIDSIQELAPNTSITRFQVVYSIDEQSLPRITLKLMDYHKTVHLINEQFNLNVNNKCSL